MEAPAHLVVHTAVGHLLQRQLHHFQGAGVEAVAVVTQQELGCHGLWELWGVAETAVEVVELGGELRVGVVHYLGGQWRESPGHLAAASHLFGELAGDALDFALIGLVCLAGGGEQAGKAGHPLAVIGREIGASVEGATLGG